MKTTLKKIISEIDFNNKKMHSDINWEILGNIFDIYDSFYSEEKRLKSYFIKKRYCTDSFVGIRAYFFDDEFIALSSQDGRKSKEDFTFVSKEKAETLKEYLLTLVHKENFLDVDFFDDGNLEQEINSTYKIEYSSQILHKQALMNEEVVEIIKTNLTNNFQHPDYFHSVEIKKENGEIVKVDCRELDFEYNK